MLSLSSVADDIQRFDRAYEANDIHELIKLCSSNTEVDKLEDRMHPWAADPQTVGALAATQIAILASRESEPYMKDEIRHAGGIPTLLELLNSKEDDRRQAAVVALSFLSVENDENCEAMFTCGSLPLLIEGMKSDLDGMRAACAQTARNVFVLGHRHRKEFLKLGGLTQLVNLLTVPTVAATPPTALFTQLEAIYHIEDLIMEGGEEVAEFTEAVKQSGAVLKIQELQKCSDPDVAEAANLLVIRLTD
eukprot:GHVT01095582.1.p1 GENE.GHVT01095582.1~~GHVT01095582.1.p1  ORF type:complete len:249 (+),score=47.79 GHVT01095582.1:199-945(+)